MERIAICPGYLVNGVPFEFSEKFLSRCKLEGRYLWTPDLPFDEQKQLLLKWCEEMGFNTDKIRDLEYVPNARCAPRCKCPVIKGTVAHVVGCAIAATEEVERIRRNS